MHRDEAGLIPPQPSDYLTREFIGMSVQEDEQAESLWENGESGCFRLCTVGMELEYSCIIRDFSSYDRSCSIDSFLIQSAIVSGVGLRPVLSDSYLICFSLEGQGELQTGESRRPVRQNECLCLDCRNQPLLRAAGDESWRCLFLHVPGQINSRLFPEFCAAVKSHAAFFLSIGSGSRCRSLLWDMLNLCSGMWKPEQLGCRLLLQLFLELDMSVTMMKKSKPSVSELIFQLQQYLQQNYSREICLDSLSSLFNISKYHMSREFKKAFGLSPIEYLIQLRIEKAKQLLLNPAYTVAQVSRLVGIQNPNHFLTLFKSRERISPGDYRRRLKGS